MMPERIETVVIGGGQAGLALSSCLTRLGHEHVVLERGRLAERWRSERWDSLALITPNWMTQLPGYAYQGDDPAGFVGRDEVVRFLEAYAASFAPPLRGGVHVASVQPHAGAARYLVQTTDLAQGSAGTIAARNVVVATGPFQQPRIPPLSAALPAGVLQLASRDYRNPTQLPPGAVLVVGSGASGCQICEDLSASGRTVYLSVGRCQRWPRRYRGTDLVTWFHLMGLLDEVGRRHFLDPCYGCAAVLTGVRGGYDLDYDRFAAAGVTLLGHLRGAESGTLVFADDLRESLGRWDASREILARMIDDLHPPCWAGRTGGRRAGPRRIDGLAKPATDPRTRPGRARHHHRPVGDGVRLRLRVARGAGPGRHRRADPAAWRHRLRRPLLPGLAAGCTRSNRPSSSASAKTPPTSPSRSRPDRRRDPTTDLGGPFSAAGEGWRYLPLSASHLALVSAPRETGDLLLSFV